MLQSLFVLSLSFVGGICASSSPPSSTWYENPWVDQALFLVIDLPVRAEVIVLQAYTLLRQYPQVAVPCFYLAVIYVLYRLSKLFAREPTYQFKVQHEASSSGLMAAIKGELEAFKQQVRKESSERPAVVQETGTPDAVKQLLKDIQFLNKTQSEFQLEMLESHKDLWRALSSLQLKVEHSEHYETPLANGLGSREPQEPFPTLATYESSDDYRIEEISHNASFGSSITPSMAFSVKEEKEDELETESPKNSRKSSLSIRPAEPIEVPTHEEPVKSTLPRPEPIVTAHPMEQKVPDPVQAAPKTELPQPPNVRSKFQSRREKLVQESSKAETRAKFVPPPAARNPFGL